MELEFKTDFEHAGQAWSRFWEGTLGRPILRSASPKQGVEPTAAPKWGAAFSEDYEKIVDQAIRWAETHDFLGDAVPFFTPSLMIDLVPAFLGAEIISVKEDWGTDTHAVPFIKDLSSAEIRFHRESPWWESWVRLCECIKRKCSGRMVMGSAFPGYNNLDTLAALRGNVELMMDFYDNPDGVHHAMRQIMTAFKEIVGEHCRIFGDAFANYGCSNHHGFYSTGLLAIPQCDFGFNIGKEHFDEFALPYLKEEIALLDSVEYHLDGPGNIAHLESICTIDKIKVIQWVPGSGNQGKDWTSLYERINNLDKGLWMGAESPEKALDLWRKYTKSGRMVLDVKAENQAEMDKYLKLFGE